MDRIGWQLQVLSARLVQPGGPVQLSTVCPGIPLSGLVCIHSFVRSFDRFDRIEFDVERCLLPLLVFFLFLFWLTILLSCGQRYLAVGLFHTLRLAGGSVTV